MKSVLLSFTTCFNYFVSLPRTHPIVVVDVSLSANTGSVSLEAETCANEKAW
jgi:hypothetical protein